ncbi:MAG: menaquinone biosynthesis decarboxylase, partial [Prevotellaceae bacterium]|nr:menaquinone biosynthesis decarboxylase [Prevotellaceae bacterium]
MTYDSRLTTYDCLRIREFVNPVLEMAEIADRMAKSGNGGKALLFENTGTAFPVLMNLYGSTPRMLQALGLGAYEEIEQRFNRLFSDVLSPKQSLWDKLKLLPALKQATQWLPEVRKERGACQDVVMPQPDLSKLPILQCWPHDGGRFITLPMVHTKDPATGARNVGMYRMQAFSNTTAGMHWHRHKTGARHFAAFAAQHKEGRFPVAVALGGDPVYAYCAVAPMPENVDEYLLAGFLRNKPVPLVRCLTQPLEVPADADFVIEGYVDVQALPETEGPFGDHTGFYSLEDLYPVMQVTSITHRKDAIYPATVVGIPPQEDAYFAQATERIFLTPIRLAVAPEIVDMHLPAEGVSHNLAIVKIKKDYPGQAIKVAHALWGAGQMMFNKIMIVVDGETEL